jgi:hypothetical protein
MVIVPTKELGLNAAKAEMYNLEREYARLVGIRDLLEPTFPITEYKTMEAVRARIASLRLSIETVKEELRIEGKEVPEDLTSQTRVRTRTAPAKPDTRGPLWGKDPPISLTQRTPYCEYVNQGNPWTDSSGFTLPGFPGPPREYTEAKLAQTRPNRGHAVPSPLALGEIKK